MEFWTFFLGAAMYILTIAFIIKVIQMAYVFPRRINELERRLKRLEDKEIE